MKFDCKWLLRYKKLHTLWLGKKAKKNLACLKDAENIKSLALRGIKLNDFEFLKKIILDNTGINIADLNKDIQEITTCY